MKKNKLFTILAAITLLTGVGTEASASLNANTVQAARRGGRKARARRKSTRRRKRTTKKRRNTKSAKKTRKAAPYAIVRIRRGAPVYIIKFNKAGTAVSRIYRKKKASFKAIKAYAYWWTRYRGTSYYYLPGVRSGKYKQIAVRTRDAKVTTRKKPFSLDAQTKKVNKVRARLAYWNKTLNAARPRAYIGTVNSSAAYYIGDSSRHLQKAGTFNAGTSLIVLFQTALQQTQSNGQSTQIPVYGVLQNKRVALVESRAVSINNGANVQSLDDYNRSYANYNSLVAKAKKEGFVFRTAK